VINTGDDNWEGGRQSQTKIKFFICSAKWRILHGDCRWRLNRKPNKDISDPRKLDLVES
jgi:hypothetical protein